MLLILIPTVSPRFVVWLLVLYMSPTNYFYRADYDAGLHVFRSGS